LSGLTVGVENGRRRLALSLGRVRVTRRTLQVVLGLFWLLDGALQLQPYMLRTSFATQVLAPVGVGQPHWVAGPVQWAANLVAAHPVAWDVPFALVQLAIGVGLLVPRTARLALAVSVAWGLGVWYLGEGLSGLASGNASLMTGAPGSVLLYVVLALAAWPRNGRSDLAPARWLPFAWATLWIGGAVLQALPMNNTGADLAGTIGGGPSWLVGVQNSLSGWVASHGTTSVALLTAAELLIGLAALSRRTLPISAVAGLVLAAAIWVFGQDFGLLYTGTATDPNTAPLAALVAVALLEGRGHVGPAPDSLGSRAAPARLPISDRRRSALSSARMAAGLRLPAGPP
jgi:hypothetical protein